MAGAAAEFLRAHLTTADARLYLRDTLRVYASLQTYQVPLVPAPPPASSRPSAHLLGIFGPTHVVAWFSHRAAAAARAPIPLVARVGGRIVPPTLCP